MSICDKVAILGMGCSRFGERWESGPEDLVVEAYTEALSDAGIEPEEIGAAWLSTVMPDFGLGGSGLGLSVALGLPNIPVTRVENFCASGTEALRGAVYAVASGAVETALAVGVDKLKDTGFGGLPGAGQSLLAQQVEAAISGPGAFAQLATAYMSVHGISRDDLKRAMAHVSVKSHRNGALNPKAHLRREITPEQVLAAPPIAEPLGLFDCCGVSDGAACAIVTTPERARALGRRDVVTVKAIQLAMSNGSELESATWSGANLPTARKAARLAYEEAGITMPREQLDLIEVHDCFSITELITMEDLGLCDDGEAPAAILDGRFDHDGAVPCQVDGGLKCFGHPIGASGLRMAYEIYLQLLARAGARQVPEPALGLTHNLGGIPSRNVASIAILGLSAV